MRNDLAERRARLGWSQAELAERLGVSRRTIRRDIDRLRELGYPVRATLGADGGYRLVAGKAMPPLVLDDEEAVAIAVGLRAGAGHALEGVDEASVRALAKLEQVLPGRLRHRVSTLQSATTPLTSGDGPTIAPETLIVMASTVAGHERLRFAYRAADGTGSRRVTEPYRLVSTGRRWYLVAYDLDRDGWRIFRVDRIDGPQPTGARVTPRELPAPDAAAYVTDKLYSGVPVHTAVATLHAPIEQVRGRLGYSPTDLEPIDEGSCRLRSHTDTLEWLAFALLRLGCDFEVHEPPELREHLRTLGERARRAAGE